MQWLIAVFFLSVAVAAQASQPPAPGSGNTKRQSTGNRSPEANVSPALVPPSYPPITLNVSVVAPTVPAAPQGQQNQGAAKPWDWGSGADWGGNAINFGIFLTTLALWRVASKQFKKQARQTHQALVLTRRELRLTQMHIEIERRAWLTVQSVHLLHPPQIGLDPVVRVALINSGNTPAVNACIDADVFIRPIDSVIEGAKTDIEVNPKTSRLVVGPSLYYSSLINMGEPLTEAPFKGLVSGAAVLYLKGVVFYSDIFGHQHWTKFAFQAMQDTFEVRDEDENGSIPMTGCPFGNDAS